MYTPEQTVTYENWIRLCYQRKYPGVKLAAPVEVSVGIYFAVPKSYSKERTTKCLANVIRPTCKPDADNVLKAVCDALNGIAYADDREITDTRTYKRYGAPERLVVFLRGNA